MNNYEENANKIIDKANNLINTASVLREKAKDIITDNYNQYFFEPKTKEDRERGYTL